MEWQPIETAPKDKMIILYRPDAYEWGTITLGKWDMDAFAKVPKPYWEMWHKIGGTKESRAWAPTHWAEIPAPPNAALTGAPVTKEK